MQEFNCETLLVFAHRAEASDFLSGAHPVDHSFEGLLTHPNYGLILICGEGLWAPRERLASVLTRFSKITQVVNLGVCAGVRAGIRTGEIYSIRTSYAEDEFKSYTSSDPSADIDCLSAKERVLTPLKAQQLDNFAPLIERELWSIASVCELFKKKWSAYKLVSDLPQNGSTEICEVVKEQANEWSRALKIFYQSKEISKNSLECEQESESLFAGAHLPFFHLTTSTERQLINLKQKLGEVRFNRITQECVQETFERPKERTLFLIAALSRALNPFRAKLEDEINAKTLALREQGIQVSYPWPLESTHFNLKFQIQSEKDIERLKSALEQFPYADLKRLIEAGELNV